MGDIRKKMKARRVIVTDQPTLISDNLHYKSTVLLKNLSGTKLHESQCVTIYLDGYDNVSVTTGYPMFPCEVITLGFQEHSPQVPNFEMIEVYGICEPGETMEIAILEEDYR